MADERRFDLEDLLLRPGCYFNPQTEIMVVVDDSPTMDAEIFNMEPFEGADWVLIADEVPVDEARRDGVRQRVMARNERRRRQGKEPLDVEAEIDRQLRDIGG